MAQTNDDIIRTIVETEDPDLKLMLIQLAIDDNLGEVLQFFYLNCQVAGMINPVLECAVVKKNQQIIKTIAGKMRNMTPELFKRLLGLAIETADTDVIKCVLESCDRFITAAIMSDAINEHIHLIDSTAIILYMYDVYNAKLKSEIDDLTIEIQIVLSQISRWLTTALLNDCFDRYEFVRRVLKKRGVSPIDKKSILRDALHHCDERKAEDLIQYGDITDFGNTIQHAIHYKHYSAARLILERDRSSANKVGSWTLDTLATDNPDLYRRIVDLQFNDKK